MSLECPEELVQTQIVDPYTRSTKLEYPRVSPGLFLIRSPWDLMHNKVGDTLSFIIYQALSNSNIDKKSNFFSNSQTLA